MSYIVECIEPAMVASKNAHHFGCRRNIRTYRHYADLDVRARGFASRSPRGFRHKSTSTTIPRHTANTQP